MHEFTLSRRAVLAGAGLLAAPAIVQRAHAAERDAVPEGHVRGRDVDPELHPQRSAELQLRLERTLRQYCSGVAGELSDVHPASVVRPPTIHVGP